MVFFPSALVESSVGGGRDLDHFPFKLGHGLNLPPLYKGQGLPLALLSLGRVLAPSLLGKGLGLGHSPLFLAMVIFLPVQVVGGWSWHLPFLL